MPTIHFSDYWPRASRPMRPPCKRTTSRSTTRNCRAVAAAASAVRRSKSFQAAVRVYTMPRSIGCRRINRVISVINNHNHKPLARPQRWAPTSCSGTTQGSPGRGWGSRGRSRLRRTRGEATGTAVRELGGARVRGYMRFSRGELGA
jgi:hypothetical protein